MHKQGVPIGISPYTPSCELAVTDVTKLNTGKSRVDKIFLGFRETK